MPMDSILVSPLSVGPRKAGVRLDAVDDHDRLRLRGNAVHVYGCAVFEVTDDHRVHGRANRNADGRFGDAVACEHLFLAFGGGGAVAAHAREHERLRAQRAQLADDRLGDLADVGDAAAAAADCDDLARVHAVPHFGTLETRSARCRSMSVRRSAANFWRMVDHARQRDVEPAGDVDFDAIGNHASGPCVAGDRCRCGETVSDPS